MNTQLAFAFGMLAMVAIIMIVAIVVGMVKVIKLEKELAHTRTGIYKSLDGIEHYVNEIRRELNDRIDKESGWIRNDITQETQNLYRRIDETQSIFDSRFDKFENRITKKQILND